MLNTDNCPTSDLSPSYYDGICSVPGSKIVWAEESLNAYAYAYKLGFTTALSIESMKRFNYLTRYDLAKLVSLYATKELGKLPDTKLPCTFRDTTKAQKQYTQLACQLGLMGYMNNGTIAKTFRPNVIVTREVLGVVLSKLLYGTSTGNYLQTLKNDGILSNIKPSLKETRGTASLMLLRTKNHAAAK